MPTRSQLVAAINTLRGRTPALPIKDIELADMLQTWLDYFDNSGQVLPETFQPQLTKILEEYDAHIETFQNNINSALGAVDLIEAKRVAVAALQQLTMADRNSAEIFMNRAESASTLARNFQDSWNPVTATPNLLTLSLNATTDKGKFWKVDVPGAANPVATTALGGTSRQVNNGDEYTWNGNKWVYTSYSDLALQKAKKLEEDMLLASPIIGARTKSDSNQGVCDTIAGTITTPVGGTGSNSYLMQPIYIADQPDWTPGTRLRFIFLITESLPGAFNNGAMWVSQIQLQVQRVAFADAQGGESGWIDHVIPWQIDDQLTIVHQ